MAKTIALIFGVVYLIVGIIGFIPAVGGTMAMSPPTSLLGIFPINLLHNIVHVVIGIIGLSMSRTEAAGAQFGKVFGLILILLGIIGFFWPANLDMTLLPLRGTDVWLHLVSGIILAAVGFGSKASATA